MSPCQHTAPRKACWNCSAAPGTSAGRKERPSRSGKDRLEGLRQRMDALRGYLRLTSWKQVRWFLFLSSGEELIQAIK